MQTKKKLVVLTGAGISAESGIRTFRDSDGMWEEYNVMDVASIQGWRKNRDLMLDFYNQRRRQLDTVHPNQGHLDLVKLEEEYDVTIVTQNVDNLHERAGSTNIIHLHGELTKARSSMNPNAIIEIGSTDINPGDKHADGSQLRPHIVWFGESVPMIEPAANVVHDADIVLVVGTSLNVYPAAGLLTAVKRMTPIFIVDPNDVTTDMDILYTHIKHPATTGIAEFIKLLK